MFSFLVSLILYSVKLLILTHCS